LPDEPHSLPDLGRNVMKQPPGPTWVLRAVCFMFFYPFGALVNAEPKNSHPPEGV
jgi:hypothetical protein